MSPGTGWPRGSVGMFLLGWYISPVGSVRERCWSGCFHFDGVYVIFKCRRLGEQIPALIFVPSLPLSEWVHVSTLLHWPWVKMESCCVLDWNLQTETTLLVQYTREGMEWKGKKHHMQTCGVTQNKRTLNTKVMIHWDKTRPVVCIKLILCWKVLSLCSILT